MPFVGQPSLGDVLDHRAAVFGAVSTGLGARGHVLIVRGLLACRGAIVATFRAAFQHVH